MPRNPNRNREEWIRDEKRTARPTNGKQQSPKQYERYSTIKEVSAILGRDEKTIKRRLARGTMPEPDALTVHDWRLWSPATVKRLVGDESRQVRR